MGVIIVDSEYESSVHMFQNIFSEALKLGQDFTKELTYLSKHGFCDVLIDNAINEKASKVYDAMVKLEEAAKDVSGNLKSFINEADETDSYLY